MGFTPGPLALVVALAISVLSGCQAAQPRQALAITATQPARCTDPGLQEAPRGIAFFGQTAWQAHLAGLNGDLRSRLWSWRVDFDAGRSVLLVSAGPQPNPGYRIAVADGSLRVRNEVLEADVTITPPPANSIQAQVISFPCLYLQLDGAAYREVAVQVAR